jgi:hypothetical protein
MNQEPFASKEQSPLDRRLFLQGLGKWSGAAITAAVAAGWFAATPRAQAGGWVNRRGGGGGWANRAGGGGGWINRYGGGGGGWVNRVRGGGAWVNRF